MVGEEANLLLVIHESFVQGLIHRGKLNVVALQFFAGKDILEALLLLLAICQYI